MSLRRLVFLAPLLGTVAWAAYGCSAGQDDPPTTAGTQGTSSGGGSGGAGGGGTNTGGSSSDGGGGGFNFGGNNSGMGGFAADAACVATSAEAQLIPLDMIILLDQSGSMFGTRWTGAVNAITTFVNEPASAGINVGLSYFPVGTTDSCDYTLYDELEVPLGELPGNAQPIIDNMATHSPNGGTPMYGAFKGTLFYATAYQDANPTHKVIVVFASDGDPTGCSGNQNDIAVIGGLLSSALNYNNVQTYIIAIPGATVSNLNQLAQAGGTGQAYDVTQNIDAFADKMAEIRATALACEFLIPNPPEGEELDPNKVAVNFDPGVDPSPDDAVEIPKAEDLADCGQGPGWYYDDNMNPTKIILCPASCSGVQGDAEGKVSVLFGCEPDVT